MKNIMLSETSQQEGIKRIFSFFKGTSLGKRKTNFAVGLFDKLKNCILCCNAFSGAIFIQRYKKTLAFCIVMIYIKNWRCGMATSSIRKNFVINSKKSAVEIAQQLIDSEKMPLPSINRLGLAKMLCGDELLKFLKKADSKIKG